MPFENQNSETISTLVKLKGNPLNHVISLKTKYYEKTKKDLHKGTAIALLLNKIPKKVIDEAIKEIVAEAK